MLNTLDDDIELAPRLRSVVARFSRSLRRTQAGANLTAAETSVLASTVRNGPIGLSQLADDEVMNPTMLSRVVRHLEELGLVNRQSDPHDARAGFVKATGAGQRLHERIRSERTDALNQLINELGIDDRHVLAEALPVLERIVVGLKGRRL